MEMQCETLNLFLDLSTHLVFSAKLLFPRSCQMTSGHKRKEVASVSVLSEACHLMAGIFKRGVTITINTQTPPLNSLVSHLVKRRASAK